MVCAQHMLSYREGLSGSGVLWATSLGQGGVRAVEGPQFLLWVSQPTVFCFPHGGGKRNKQNVYWYF